MPGAHPSPMLLCSALLAAALFRFLMAPTIPRFIPAPRVVCHWWSVCSCCSVFVSVCVCSIQAVHLTPVPFSVENHLLTPTFKLKRNVAAKFFEKEIAAMYGKGAGAPVQPAMIQSKL